MRDLRPDIAIADAPWLYRFLRENFYAVMEMGELDLTADEKAALMKSADSVKGLIDACKKLEPKLG